MKAELSLRSLFRSSGKAGRSGGEGVSQQTGETGSLPLGKRGLGAGEARRRRRGTGGGESGRPLKGREPRAPRTHARASRSSSQARASDHAPSSDGADVRGGGAWPPSPPRWGRVPPRALQVAGCHLCLQGGGLRSRNREHVSLSGSSRSPPPRRRSGRSWACPEESAPGFPAHFNSVSASAARRGAALPGAPEPSAGTRFTSPTPLPAKGGWELAPLPRAPQAGPPRPSSSGVQLRQPWQRGCPDEATLRDYLTSPCAR